MHVFESTHTGVVYVTFDDVHTSFFCLDQPSLGVTETNTAGDGPPSISNLQNSPTVPIKWDVELPSNPPTTPETLPLGTTLGKCS